MVILVLKKIETEVVRSSGLLVVAVLRVHSRFYELGVVEVIQFSERVREEGQLYSYFY